MQRIVQIGLGQVVRERIFPAMKVLSEEGLLSVEHVIDVLPAEDVFAILHGLLPSPPKYHRIGGTTAELARLLQSAEMSGRPVLVATPTPFHPAHACAALSAGCPVAIEKPLAASSEGLNELDTCINRHPGKVFALGYYLIEKGLPLLALARRGRLSPAQLGCLAGLQPEEWLQVRERLGAVVAVTALLNEGPDERSWVLTNEAGGHTLETFSHLVAMVLPWLAELRLQRAVLGSAPEPSLGTSEGVMFAEFTGPNSERVLLGCAKWSPPASRQRWVEIHFEHGSAMMNLETECLTIDIGDDVRRARVVSRAKYEPQLRAFAEKIESPETPTELDIARRSVKISLNVRKRALESGLRQLTSSWLMARLLRGESNGREPP